MVILPVRLTKGRITVVRAEIDIKALNFQAILAQVGFWLGGFMEA